MPDDESPKPASVPVLSAWLGPALNLADNFASPSYRLCQSRPVLTLGARARRVAQTQQAFPALPAIAPYMDWPNRLRSREESQMSSALEHAENHRADQTLPSAHPSPHQEYRPQVLG